jgi:hypothetical protein
LQRTIQTGQYLPYTKLTWKSLDELDAGVCDGMTYAEIEVSHRRRSVIKSYSDVSSKRTQKILLTEMRTNSIIDTEVSISPILQCLFGRTFLYNQQVANRTAMS